MTQRRLIPFISSESEVLPAIGIKPEEFAGSDLERVTDQNMFKMIYAGRANDWKGIKIFLNALTEVKQRKFSPSLNIEVRLIGIRNGQERSKVQQWVKQFALQNEVQVIDFMKREQMLKEIKQYSLSVYPAFRDSGSMAVLEACAIGCPVICFDTPGQDVFPDRTVCKISIKNDYEKTVIAFAEKIIWCIEQQSQLAIMSKAARRFVHEELNWKSKVARIIEFYKHILE
jgi:glycosyltransferase involved in cell wall biosynthesis